MKKTLLTLLLLVFCLNCFAQVPVNDNCANAIALSSTLTCIPTAGTNAGVITSDYDGCAEFTKRNVWYKFTATSTNQIVQLTRGSIQNVTVDLRQFDCNATASTCDMGSNEAIITKVFSGLVVGSVYFISVATREVADAGTFNICLIDALAPINNECSSATSISVLSTNYPSTRINGTTTFATQSLQACGGHADDDVWYSFTATQTSHRLFLKTLDFTGSATVQLFSGSCGTLVSKQCILSGFSSSDNSSQAFTDLEIGQTYFFRIYSLELGNVGGTFSVALTSSSPNDHCYQAIGLNPAIGEDFSTAVLGSTFDATLSSNDCFNSTTTDDDIWYFFTATQKVHKVKIKGWPSNQAKIQAFKGSCGGLESISCNNMSYSVDTTSTTLSALNIGETYFFRVYSNTINTNQSLFSIAVTSPMISPIDDCENAQWIVATSNNTCNNTLVSTKNAYPSAITGTCGDGEKDIYLKFVATATQHQIKVASHHNTIFKVSFQSGNCGNLQSLRCGGSLDSNSYLGNLTIGQTYYFRITSDDLISDSFNVCISAPTFRLNDECAGAEELSILGNAITCKPVRGSFSNSSQSVLTECGTTDVLATTLIRDVWYKFTALATQQRLRFTKLAGENFKFELYQGSCGTLTYLDCSTNIVNYSEKVFEELSVGETYFIRVLTTSIGDLEFEVCLKAYSPPVNDVCSNAVLLPVNSAWNSANYVKGTTFDSDATMGSNTCGQADAYDVWYKFIATNTLQNIVFSSQNTYPDISGMVVAVYYGSCGGFQIDCKVADFTTNGENVLKLTGLSAGQTYYIKVYSSLSNTSSQGFFNIQVNNEVYIAPNNDCTTADVLPIYPNASQVVFKAGNTANATTSAQTLVCSGLGTPDDDIWYSFVASKTRIRIQLSSTFVLPCFVVYSGSCQGTLNVVLCSIAVNNSSAIERIIEKLTVGHTYLIRVFSSANSSQIRGKISIGLSEDTEPPANDLCANTTNLTVSANNTPTFVNSSIVNARIESNSCSSGGDVWFRFVASATSHRINYEGFIQSAQIGVYSGTCAAKDFRACNGAIHGTAFTVSDLAIGTQYFVSVGTSNTSIAAQGNFKIAITTPQVPVNNLCSGAISLVSGSYHTTNLATSDSPDCYYKSKQDVWFSLKATSAKMKVVVDNLNTNSVITAYSGSCGTLNRIGCTYSMSQFLSDKNILNLTDLTVGQTYLIRVISAEEQPGVTTIVEIPLEFRIFAENNPEPTENSLFLSLCLGANLVPNPGFEYYTSCPSSFNATPATPGQWLSANNHWKIPTMGSSDYFNDCAAFDANIEGSRNNTFGLQNPRNGTAYGGFSVGGPSPYREYLSTKLSTPLQIGKRYVLSMYVSRSDYFSFASNNIGFGLTMDDVSLSTYDTLSVDTLVMPTVSSLIKESGNWINIAATFIADQPYSFLHLGNFKGQQNSLTTKETDISGGKSGGYSGQGGPNAYYFVDDVLVAEASDDIACAVTNCNSILTLISPTNDVLDAAITKTTNFEINANITIHGTSNVLFNAGKFILMDGTQGVFEVKNGSYFEAKIGGCVN